MFLTNFIFLDINSAVNVKYYDSVLLFSFIVRHVNGNTISILAQKIASTHAVYVSDNYVAPKQILMWRRILMQLYSECSNMHWTLLIAPVPEISGIHMRFNLSALSGWKHEALNIITQYFRPNYLAYRPNRLRANCVQSSGYAVLFVFRKWHDFRKQLYIDLYWIKCVFLFCTN
jgi:hypothetical protein